MYLVVTYDITSNRRRARLHELLLGYGSPVQKSVFECLLSGAQLRELRARSRALVKGPRDSMRFYHLCARCQERTQGQGTALAAAGPQHDYTVP
ncbi:MAG: CRISPR-associated endonuclease Cas2 [Chloroflexi bacterium]|nr:CRISPR-associated endonuclease Cas2 [Chloroflexota bacterium]